jgi:hypothetical protein
MYMTPRMLIGGSVFEDFLVCPLGIVESLAIGVTSRTRNYFSALIDESIPSARQTRITLHASDLVSISTLAVAVRVIFAALALIISAPGCPIFYAKGFHWASFGLIAAFTDSMSLAR